MPGAIIHHPLSDIKKISFIDSFSPSFTSPSSDFSTNCIQSSGTGGLIEPNSSGSAVFDNQKNIIGTCSYGGSGCVAPGGINFVGGGKFWFHWDQNGTSPDRQLKPWLDPLNTGVMAFQGKYPNNTGITHTVVKNTFSIYPNPASDNFKILTDKAVLQVTLYNILGEKVGSWKNTRFIPIQQLPPGVYFTIIKFPREIYSVKIIKRN
jgi:Secretion system C-terminal sorting domain